MHPGVACRVSHLIELPYQTSFCFFFYVFVSLLLAAYHFDPADVRDASCLLYELCLLFCNFVRPSLTPSQSTVAALSYNFTGGVLLTDEVSTVRFVAARLSPLKEYRASIVRSPIGIARGGHRGHAPPEFSVKLQNSIKKITT